MVYTAGIATQEDSSRQGDALTQGVSVEEREGIPGRCRRHRATGHTALRATLQGTSGQYKPTSGHQSQALSSCNAS